MSEMDSAAIAAGALPQTAQPQANRLRWEQQWLRENRNAFEVINTARGADEQAAGQLPLFDAAELPASTSVRQSARVADTNNARSGAAAPIIAAEIAAPLAPTIAPAANGGSGWLNTSLHLQLDAAANTASSSEYNAAPGSERGAAKTFALWVSDDEVKVALRLRREQREGEVIAALRRWLREAGLTLRTLIVNGVTRWRREPPRSDGF